MDTGTHRHPFPAYTLAQLIEMQAKNPTPAKAAEIARRQSAR